jgi:hypothetical protein
VCSLQLCFWCVVVLCWQACALLTPVQLDSPSWLGGFPGTFREMDAPSVYLMQAQTCTTCADCMFAWCRSSYTMSDLPIACTLHPSGHHPDRVLQRGGQQCVCSFLYSSNE